VKENLFNSANKATNDRYRSQYDVMFGRRCLKCRKDEVNCRCDVRIGHYESFSVYKNGKKVRYETL